jgi:hypothetical protein
LIRKWTRSCSVGGVSHGEFAFTLNLTDACTGWTEPRAGKNKAQKWTVQALNAIKEVLPFELLGVDSDNGSEFLNAHLVRYCAQRNITFTRSRPYRKNDNCFVEQKNDDIVRRYVGYQRYEGEEQVALLNAPYDRVRLFVNFFPPSAKLVKKTREGSKVKKLYDDPQTPCQRLLRSEHVPERAKCRLRQQFDSLNPAELQRSIRRLQRTSLGGRQGLGRGPASDASRSSALRAPWRSSRPWALALPAIFVARFAGGTGSEAGCHPCPWRWA